MAIPNTIQKLTYKGVTYHGHDTNEILCLMNESIPMRELGRLFGCTLSAIQYRISRNCNQNMIRDSRKMTVQKRNLKIINDLNDGLSDDEIAIKHNTSPQVVRKLRTSNLPMTIKQKIPNLSERRRRLCYSLFGYDYLPGPKFVLFIDTTIGHLQNWELLLIREYYILGQISNHKQIPNRSNAKSKLREQIQSLFTLEELEKEMIICKK